jgi:hypothetical protein
MNTPKERMQKTGLTEAKFYRMCPVLFRERWGK